VYCGRVEVGTGGEVTAGNVGEVVAVCVGARVCVYVFVGLGDEVALGGNVNVGGGVNVSSTGWKGVGVALAFGSTVTRLRGGEEAGGSALGREQETSDVRQSRVPRIREIFPKITPLLMMSLRASVCRE